MRQRQSRNRARLQTLRMLQPGEVDHEVDAQNLPPSPAADWDPQTVAYCAFLYDRYILSETTHPIPDHAFCDLPLWVFLEYLVRFQEMLLMGSNISDLPQLEPLILSKNVHGWN